MSNKPPIALVTDFGLKDAYVGIMKSVIVSICPDARIIDLCHEVPAQNIESGAYLLSSASQFLPDDTIVVGVVDPGVGGGDRRSVAVETDNFHFVGPDNGLFDLSFESNEPIRAVELTNPAYQLNEVHDTFHSRDIFAPAGAYLANGVGLKELGDPFDTEELVELPARQTYVSSDYIECHVMHVDHFGNLITSLLVSDLLDWCDGQLDSVNISLDGRNIPISESFGDAGRGRPLAYFGSSNRLEIAIRGGNAANLFNAGQGTNVVIEK
jgi:S-adenosylmethionine hydrolase